MHATTGGAFNSVNQLIMRDVNAGWLLRYAHMNGASFFFIVTYIHIFRGLYYGSYKAPRELVWMLGLVIYLLMMATAFMGYVLPWGQMSYWGAQVITGFFSAFPLVGEPIRIWLLGGYAPDQAALTRFFSLHYLLPFVIAAVVILHIWALHIPGSSNPTGVDVKDEKDTLPFHPFYTAKDGWFAGGVLLVYAVVTYFAPNYLGHPDNYIPANALATPAHIVPEWYFWPFYAILRSFTVDFILEAKLWGVLAMFGSILLLFFLPWLDRSPVRSGAYRPVFKRFFWLLVIDVLILGYVGGAPINWWRDGARPDRGGLLLPPLPGDPAARLGVRDAAAAAEIDQRDRVLHGEEAEAAPAGSRPRGAAAAADGPVRGQAGRCVSFSVSSARSSPESC